MWRWSRESRASGVDLVRREFTPRGAREGARHGRARAHAPRRLLVREGRRHRQEAEPGRGLPLGLDVLGIAEVLAEHLEAAADAEDGPARRGPGDDGRGEAGRADPRETSDRA